tara:strand:- start:1065 stop:1337 length:273 start_codon:yes stop_codon:yes gene_type:complete
VCDDDNEKKYRYYFWLDEMIIELWCEYLDLLIANESIEKCDNKMKVIEFYQSEVDSLMKDISYKEFNEWRIKHNLSTTTQKLCSRLFGDF